MSEPAAETQSKPSLVVAQHNKQSKYIPDLIVNCLQCQRTVFRADVGHRANIWM